MDAEILEKYGDRLRVRVCGLCWSATKLLVANHHIKPNRDFWAPIGGGVEFGESLVEALMREFKEEASIQVIPGKFLFGCEFKRERLHAIELFFEVTYKAGEVSLGSDPESLPEYQILKEVKYFEFLELMALKEDKRHGIFQLVSSAEELKKLSGFYIL